MYTSLSKLSKYLYKVTFNRLEDYQQLNVEPQTACSSFVKDGKLYRNLDWSYDDTNEFFVIAPGFRGMSLIPGLTDSNPDPSLIEQLPYHINDGVNDFGIMVSSHILFDDFGHTYSGNTNITKIPYIVLSTLRSIDDIGTLQSILDDVYIPDTLLESQYLMQFLVSDGNTSYVLTPSDSGYEVVDITSNPKLTNFKWVAERTVTRYDEALQLRPTGVERWNLIENNPSLEELKFTGAYTQPDRLSEFIGIGDTDKYSTDTELLNIYNYASSSFPTRKRDGKFWQTMHSCVYSSSGIESLYAQEDYSTDYSDLIYKTSLTESVFGALNAVPGLTAMYESPYSANLKIDRMKPPFGIFYLVRDFEIDTRLNRFNDSASIEVFFCRPIALDAKGLEFDAAVEEMTLLAKQFLVNLKANNSISVSDIVRVRTATGKFDKNVAGVSLEFTVYSKNPTCF